MKTSPIPVIDLFAGPGGLGEGFSAVQDVLGRQVFRLALSVEKDPFAVMTLRLRAFCRCFKEPPPEYYEFLRVRPDRQAQAMQELFEAFPDAGEAAMRQVLPATLGRTKWVSVFDELDEALSGLSLANTASPGEPWVLIGGPPCQAYSLVGRARMTGRKDNRERARLHRLYRHYLRILDRYKPPIFVMENVKGLLSAKVDGKPVFERILRHLEKPGSGNLRYIMKPLVISQRQPWAMSLFARHQKVTGSDCDHHAFLIKSEQFGVPQTRHRVIVLGIESELAEALGSELPGLVEATRKPGILDVIAGLPRLRSGLSKAEDSLEDWRNVILRIPAKPWFRRLRRSGLEKVEQRIQKVVRIIESDSALPRGDQFMAGVFESGYVPEWYGDSRLGGVCNHETRSHIESDLERYCFAASFAAVMHRSPRLKDFPPELHPEHENLQAALGDGLFGDRFKVQIDRDVHGAAAPATTITSHIAKDGHYFIHYDPTQCRSLTVREAARIQTFPDNYAFLGPRTEQYKQVGNAVPPFLAWQIGNVVARMFRPSIDLSHRGRIPNQRTEMEGQTAKVI